MATVAIQKNDQSVVFMVEWEMLMRETVLRPKYEGINYLKELNVILPEEK